MDWFLYDNGLRHERVKNKVHLNHQCPEELNYQMKNFCLNNGKSILIQQPEVVIQSDAMVWEHTAQKLR